MRDTNRKNSQMSGYSSQNQLSAFNQGPTAVTNSQTKLMSPPKEASEEIKVSNGQMDSEIFPNDF